MNRLDSRCFAKKALFSVAAIASGAAFAANPILPLWEYIPDGEPYVFDDPDNPGKMRVYLYGSHDTLRNSYCGYDYTLWSAPLEDLNRWRCHFIACKEAVDLHAARLAVQAGASALKSKNQLSPLRRRRGFGIMIVLNPSAVQVFLRVLSGRATWLADGTKEGFGNYLYNFP